MGLYVLEIKANIKGFILICELANSLYSYILLSLFLVLPTILSTTFSSAQIITWHLVILQPNLNCVNEQIVEILLKIQYMLFVLSENFQSRTNDIDKYITHSIYFCKWNFIKKVTSFTGFKLLNTLFTFTWKTLYTDGLGILPA